MRQLVKYLPAPALLGLAGLILFGLGRCTAPKPIGPSRDSTSLTHFADSLDHEAAQSAGRDSVRAAHVDSTVGTVEKNRARLRQRLATGRSTRPAPDSGSDTVAALLVAIRGLEADTAELRQTLDSVLTADSVAIQTLEGQFRDQRAETARVRGLLAGASDSLQRAANRIGQLERTLSDRWSLCAAGGLGTTVGEAGTAAGAGPGAAVGGSVLLGVCYRIL